MYVCMHCMSLCVCVCVCEVSISKRERRAKRNVKNNLLFLESVYLHCFESLISMVTKNLTLGF